MSARKSAARSGDERPANSIRGELRAVDAAIGELDAGCSISLEAVEEWVASWDTEDELPMPRPGE